MGLEASRIAPAVRGTALTAGSAAVSHEPLFGMHNRDYPSIWSLSVLARLVRSGPLQVGEAFREVTKQAWQYADKLTILGRKPERKLTALFPTNKDKPQSAEEGFKAFAIGSYTDPKKTIRVSGPLFQWKAITILVKGGDARVGVTEEGYALLEGMEGLSLETPHERQQAESFFNHLQRYCQEDWWGFELLLASIGSGMSRQDLAGIFGKARQDWNDSKTATSVSGYVARSREWGLLQYGQVDGKYVLAPFGTQMRDSGTGSS
jgi:hypothetical protein